MSVGFVLCSIVSGRRVIDVVDQTLIVSRRVIGEDGRIGEKTKGEESAKGSWSISHP